ncbi:chtBD2 [Euproctis pseudoconspersa nucleopolyhedrovirus]|uniref:ChtBD2 n=1 Tax=Euproctis pseudoconspersa nucleopolyhedrovirus TaxID=307467 RepID=C3TWZ2_9ABAC|nr:chtBD2 [Euproctis pseudoconspersa nucleopolyhedrovirus]ACO53534.1 chtBD2 [Euproctis pseudoconspersa nucleopolyhedrovirus]QUJ09274.1 chtBD2 protein [Gynaephora ruoergensis nucleopolyhedrovirus]
MFCFFIILYVIILCILYYVVMCTKNNDDDKNAVDCTGVFGNLPHPTNPNAYYLCVGNNAVLLYCSPNYVYDHNTMQCVPRNSKAPTFED